MPDLALDIDDTSGVPPFEQVREGIRSAVDSGGLVPGFRLPPVRTLATSLGLTDDVAIDAVRRALGS